jgi:sec-independent protein translocase protein TatC
MPVAFTHPAACAARPLGRYIPRVLPDPRNPDATMSFLDHLEELRRRILWSLATLVVCAGLGFWLTTALNLIGFLTRPVRPLLEDGRLAYLHPTEPFMVTVKVGLFIGIVLALPVLFWHFWRFVAPGLLEREKRIFVPALVSSVGLFVAGAALAFFVALPIGLKFFLGFASESLEPVIRIGDYFSFAMQITLMFGVIFETPLVIIVLTYVGLLSPRTLKRYRRHAIAVMAFVAAVLTPADVISMILMLVPLLFLYEGSVQVASLIERRREKRLGASLRDEARRADEGLRPSDA